VRVAELEIWEVPRELLLRSMLAVSILVLNVLDVLTTHTMLARGGTEMNPVSARLIEIGILPHTKISLAAFIAVASLAAAGHRRVSNLLMMVACFYLVVVAGNSLQLIAHG